MSLARCKFHGGLETVSHFVVPALGAALALVFAVPSFADETFFHLQPHFPQRVLAVVKPPAGHISPGENEAPVRLAAARWEGSSSPQTTTSAFSLDESGGAGRIRLLQEAGPLPTTKPDDPPRNDREATRVNILTGIGNVSPRDYRPLIGKQRWEFYVNQNFTSMGAYFGPILSSLIDQMGGQPPEWGGGLKGYGTRMASRIGTGIIQGTAQSAGCALLGEDPRYVRSPSNRFLSRMGHAFLYSLITYNNEGKKRIAFSSLASYYISSFATDSWLPGRYTILGDGVRDGNRQIILAGLVNQVQEFWPDLRKLFRRRP